MSVRNTAELTIEGLIHDLNNVFQTIAEGAELLSADRSWARLAGTLRRSVEQGKRIASSLLEDKRSSALFTELAERAIQFVHDYLEAVHGPSVSFTFRIDPAFRVNGDDAAWERVLVNLFVNSAEAGGKNIVIEASGDEIVISDDGPGIPPELLSDIFQPHVSTKPILSGLGLYVVRSIVEEDGGSVVASQGENGGAVFRITVHQTPD